MLEPSERTSERNGASAAVDDNLALRINAVDLEYRLGDPRHCGLAILFPRQRR
jgi:hypothetical protein